MTKSLEELRSQRKGRGRAGCRVCGDASAGYFSVHVKEPNASQAGKAIKGMPHPGSKGGAAIISRSFTFCEKHLLAAWDGTLEILDGLE